MSNHTASQVAKWFLVHNRIAEADFGAEKISNLKLQKLLYYAQGSFLAVTNKPLFDEPLLAWMHGPVVESVYEEYKKYGSDGIHYDGDFDLTSFSQEENNLLTQVFNEFGQFSAWKLRNMTHQETPWLSTKRGETISTDVIMDYFKREYLE